MRLSLAPALLYARARGGAALFLALGLVLVLAAITPVEPAQVPLRDPAAVRVLPLVATVPGLLLGASLLNPEPALEVVSSRDAVALRVLWALFLVLVSTIVLAVALGGPFGQAEVMIRNHLFAFGLTATAATVLPPAGSWGPVGLVVAANGVYGTVDFTATPHWWALLEQPPGAVFASVVAGMVFLTGVLLWVWRGSVR